MIDTPPHPEYPCAHCAVGAAFATVVASALGAGDLATPLMITPADAAGRNAVTRSWKRAADFVPEVSNARIWGGMHYRNSTDIGVSMGNALGQWVIATQLRPVASPP